jgi:hypothetical protein
MHGSPHWHVEDGSLTPVCFACRREITVGERVLLVNVDGVIVWWHYACAPSEHLEATA